MIDLELNLGGDYTDGTGEDAIMVAKGDFSIRNGKFSLVPADDLGRQVGQRLHVRLGLRRGEVFFNTAAGFPYTDLSKFKRQTGLFDTYMKAYIIATDGVDQLIGYRSENDGETRSQNVTFDVIVASSRVITITQELDV